MLRPAAVALSLLAVVACSDAPSAPRLSRAPLARPMLDLVELHEATPLDTVRLQMYAGESVHFQESVLARLQIEQAVDCAVTNADVARVAFGYLIAQGPGEAMITCSAGRHTRLAMPDEPDEFEESWTWRPLTIALRVLRSDGVDESSEGGTP